MMPLTAADLNLQIYLPDAWIVDFAPSHAHLAPALHADTEITPDWIVEQARHGPAFTLICRGRIAAVWGLVIPWPGLAEGWMWVTPDIRPVARAFTWQARKFCDIAAISLALRRIQIHVRTSSMLFERWARAAGFAEEAVLANYLPDGGSVRLMARLFSRSDS